MEARERIHQFPQRFDALRKSLAEFIQPLFMENVFQDTPVMRGLYFTSGTQDVRLAERSVTGAAAEVFGNHRATAESTEGRSFFLWDVFNKVMFQDQKLAVRSSMEELRLRKQRYTLTLACLATAALFLLLPAFSYVENLEMVRDLRDTIVSVKLQETDDIGRVLELSPLQKRLKELHQHQVEGPPFWMRMGMYQGDKLFLLAQEFYNSQLKGLLVGRQHARIKQALQNFSSLQDRPDWAPSTDAYGRSFNDLKMYLLITQPGISREPGLDAAHQSWLVWQIVQHWRDIRGKDRDANVEEAIVQHASMYIAMMANDPKQLGFLRDENLVRGARRALNRIPLAELELERLIADAEKEYPAMTLGDMVGAVPEMRAKSKIRAAFTKRAWEEMMKRRLDEAFEERQAWVLNRDSREDEFKLKAELQTLYYREYAEEWGEFLSSITVEEPKNIEETERLLTSLTRGATPPFSKLLRRVEENVVLEPRLARKDPGEGGEPSLQKKVLDIFDPQKPSKNKDKWALAYFDNQPTEDRQRPEFTSQDLANTFSEVIAFNNQKSATDDKEEKLTQLQTYQDQLRLVLDTIIEARDKPSESGLLLQKIKSARTNVERIIGAQNKTQALFTKLLLPPLKEVRDLWVHNVSCRKSQLWFDGVFVPYMDALGSRYPFNKTSPLDTPLAELSENLRPSDNVVKRFLKAQLLDDVLTEGGPITFNPTSASRDMYRGELLSHLESREALSRALFPSSDETQPTVRFQVRIRAGTSASDAPSEIASIKFIMDGTDVLYRNGPDNVWQRLIWPGQAGEMGATLQVVNAKGDVSEIIQSGEWGLFRLLEKAKRIEPSPDGRFFTATWEVQEFNGAQVSIDIRPERLNNPFFNSSGGKVGKLMQLFRDPHILPPRKISLKDCAPVQISAQASP